MTKIKDKFGYFIFILYSFVSHENSNFISCYFKTWLAT